MRFRIIPLEERIVLDASGVQELLSLDDYFEDFDDYVADGEQSFLHSWETDEKDIHVLVISSEIPHPEKLIKSAKPNIEIVYYDAKTTSLKALSGEIRDILEGNKANSIAFANHGEGGKFFLTPEQEVSLHNINDAKIQAFWKDIASHVNKDGNINLLSCSLASNAEGLDLLQNLEDLTGVNFSASTNQTGSPYFSADWILETDGINASLLYFQADLIPSWKASLAVPLISDYKAGKALSFDGIDDNITVNYSPELFPENELTIEAWVKLDADSTGYVIQSDSYSISLEENEKICVCIQTDAGSKEISIDLPENKDWVHLTTSYDGGKIRVYLNGELSGDITHAGKLLEGAEILIGSGTDEMFLKMQLDELRIWECARSPEEIIESYRKILNGTEGELKGYWRFEAGSGDTAYDFSGNNNHGSLNGTISSQANIEQSHFNNGLQGWKTVQGDSEGMIFHFPSGGNADGFISTYDLSPAGNFWKAPPAFTGNLSSAYGGELSFDLRQADISSPLESENDIFLKGDSLTLIHNIEDPNLSWTSYSIPLSESASWKRADSGSEASAEEIQTVLSSLESLEIRAKFQSTASPTDLDNVKINAPESSTASWIHSSAEVDKSLLANEDEPLDIFLKGVDPNGNAIQAKITSLPSKGKLFQYDGTEITTVNTLVNDSEGKVVFSPDPQENGLGYSSFQFVIENDSAQSEEGKALIDVKKVNDAPTLSINANMNLDEAQGKILSNEFLLFNDDESSAFLTFYTLETLPSHGTLQYLGVPLEAGDSFTQADIDRNRILYLHDNSETVSDSFSFKAKDENSASTESITFNLSINRVNDLAPSPGGDTTATNLLNGPLSITEDSPSPDSANIRLSVPTLFDTDNITPSHIRILDIIGGSLKQSDGSDILLGEDGSLLPLSSNYIDLRFTPEGNREQNASFQYLVVDPDDESINSQKSTATINISATNDSPLISSSSSPSFDYTENDGSVAIDKNIVLHDDDVLPQADDLGTEIHGASISILEGYAPDQDILLFSDENNITGNFNNETGVLTLTGTASINHYQKALRSVCFFNKSENPNTTTRTIRFTVSDDQSTSDSIERNVMITAVDDKPVAIDQGPGKALLFDGKNDFVDLGEFELGGNLSFESWIYADRIHDAYSRIFDFGNGAEEDNILLSLDEGTGRLLFLVRENDLISESIITTNPIPEKEWIHVAATIEGTTGKIYINGEEAASGEILSPEVKTRSLQYLAKSNYASNKYFDGKIDEFRIWNRSISSEEINDKMKNRLAGDESELLGYWRFDEGKGFIAEDTSENDRHGKLGGTPQQYQVLTASSFENDREGWKISVSGNGSEDATYQSSGGNSGGYLSKTNPDATWSYWEAPQKFHGDKSSAYGGILHFELRDQGSGREAHQTDLFLRGNGITLSYNTGEKPDSSNWTSYDIALHESSGWTNHLTGKEATKEEVEEVLENIDLLKIRAEYLSGNDTFHLDNVFIAKTNSPSWIDSKADIHKTVTVEENTDTVIPLAGSDLEQTPLQAKITRLINLFQFNKGLRGLPVTASNPILSDPLMRVVFSAGRSTTTSLSFQVSDDNANYDSNEASVDIEVLSVNNAPVISLTNTDLSIFEDIEGYISGIAINDEDVNETENAKMTLTLSTEHGKISLADTKGISFLEGDGIKDKNATFRGSLDDLNNAINSIAYLSDKNYTGEETLRIKVNDEGNTGSGGELEDSEDLNFFVSPFNDKPELQTPASKTVVEDNIFPIAGVRISDLDIVDPSSPDNSMEVNLSVSHGTLAIGEGARNHSMTLNGSLSYLNAALESLNYLSDEHYNGPDALNVSVNDQNAIGSGPPLEDDKTVDITVNPSNDAPTLSLPPAQVVDEDQNLLLPAIEISDLIDVNNDSLKLYEIQLSLDHGNASLKKTEGLAFSKGSGVSDREMTFKGNIRQINEAISGILYRSNLHYHGDDTLNFTVSDLGNEGEGNILLSSGSVAISVHPTDDPYIVHAPKTLVIEEGKILDVENVFISDIDLTQPNVVDPSTVNIEVSLSVSNGTISTSNLEAHPSLILSGSLKNVNETLKTLNYKGNDHYKGSDNLLINVVENGNVISSNTIFLTIDAVNDAPVLTVPGAQTCQEESVIVINGFSVSDIDIDETINAKFLVKLQVSHGILHLNQVKGLTFSEGLVNGTPSITFRGTKDDVNNAISSISYTSDLNYNGEDALVISVDDQGNSGLGGKKETSDSVSIMVEPTNDAPILSVSSVEREVYEDEDLEITGTQISDLDIQKTDGLLKISLSASHGNLTLKNSGGLHFESGGSAMRNMTFTANLEDANNALASINYRSEPNYNGSDELSLFVDDLGYTENSEGQGETNFSKSLTDSANVKIHVHALNDSPELFSPEKKVVFEDSPTKISGFSLSDLDVNENLDTLMRGELQVNYGSLTIVDDTGIDFLTGDGVDDTFMRLQGQLSAINNALNSLEYTGNLHYYSDDLHESDTLLIAIDDRGNSGSVKNANGEILPNNILGVSTETAIEIQPVNDKPTLSLPGRQEVNEDQDLFMNIDIDDRDIVIAPNIQIKATLSAEHGKLSLSSLDGLDFEKGTGIENDVIICKGKVDDLNKALENLKYHAEENYHGYDVLNIEANDMGNIGQGDILKENGSITITVNPINDQPLLTIPSAQDPITLSEDSECVIHGIHIEDPDKKMDPDIELKVSLEAENGTLFLSETSNLDSQKITGNGEKFVQIQGNISDLNDALNGLKYCADLHYHDSDAIKIHVSDLGNISSLDRGNNPTEILEDEKTIPIEVLPVNDAPILSVVAADPVNEEEVLLIKGIHLDDRDVIRRPDIELQAQLSVTNGTISLSDIDGLQFMEGDGSGDKAMTFKGTVPSLKKALETVSYVGDTNYHGPDALHISIDDLGNVSAENEKKPLQDHKTIDLTVLPINDKPIWTVPEKQTVNEDELLLIEGVQFEDKDISMDQNILFEASLSVSHGNITLNASNELLFSSGNNGEASMSFQGTLANINEALKKLSYQSDLHYHDKDQLELEISDLGNISILDSEGKPTEILNDQASVEIDILPINDPPALTLPNLEYIQATEDQDSFIQGISIDDRDLSRRPDIEAEVSLKVEHGAITLGDISGIDPNKIYGNGEKEVRIQGQIDDLNAALNNIKYRSDLNYHDEDKLDIVVSDLGNTSPLKESGIPEEILFDDGCIPIQISPINDPPSLIAPENIQSLNEDTDFFITGISLSDTDVLRRPDIPLEVSLKAEHGILTLNAIDDLNFSKGKGNNDAEMIFQGKVENLNTALLNIKYRPDEHYYGSDSLVVNVNDLGNTGNGNELSANSLIDIRVEAVNDAPTLSVPSDQVVKEDTDILIEGFKIDDRDVVMDESILMEFLLSANHGAITLSHTNGLNFSEGSGSGDSEIIARGTVSNINEALKIVAYRGDLHYHGEDTITIKVDDLGNTGKILPPVEGVMSLNVIDDEYISVESINDPPTIDPVETQEALEDTFHPITGVLIGDPDAEIHPEMELEVLLSVEHGTLSIDLLSLYDNPDFHIDLLQGFGSFDKTLHFRGNIADLNATLSTLLYCGDLDYNSKHPDAPDTLKIKVNDLGNSGEIHFPNEIPSKVSIVGENLDQLLREANVHIIVESINDRPDIDINVPLNTIVNPETGLSEEKEFFRALEDTVLKIDGITIFDADVKETENSLMEIKLRVLYGTLNMEESQRENLSFSEGDGKGNKKMTFQGSIEDINNALSTLEYLGEQNYYSGIDESRGNDFFSIEVNDLGNTGLNGPLSREKIVEIQVLAVNDAPENVDILVDNTESHISGYTVIASFNTTDADPEDLGKHAYTILESPHEDYLIQDSQLLIANKALLGFDNMNRQEVLVSTKDPGGLEKEQMFIISDRDVPEEDIETLPDEVKLFVNKAIANAARNLRGILTIEFNAEQYDDLTSTKDLGEAQTDSGYQEAGEILQTVAEKQSDETIKDPRTRFLDRFRKRTSNLLKLFR